MEGKPLSEKEDSNWSPKCSRKIIFLVPIAQKATSYHPAHKPSLPFSLPSTPKPSPVQPTPNRLTCIAFITLLKNECSGILPTSSRIRTKGCPGFLCWFLMWNLGERSCMQWPSLLTPPHNSVLGRLCPWPMRKMFPFPSCPSLYVPSLLWLSLASKDFSPAPPTRVQAPRPLFAETIHPPQSHTPLSSRMCSLGIGEALSLWALSMTLLAMGTFCLWPWLY